MKEIHLLSKGIFSKAFMDSKATTRTVSQKEQILGHLIGPLGMIFVVNTIAALVEKFFTQQTGAMYGAENADMIALMGSRYEVIMTVTKLLGIVTSLATGWLVQHTQSRQGRLRPWYLISGFVCIVIGCLIFQFPGSTLGQSYWYWFFFLLICYNTIGTSFFYTFRDTIVSLSSRSPSEKMRLKFVRQVCWTLISGIVIGMVINMVVLPMWLEHDINGYPLLMTVLSLAAIPLLLMEYYYTRERITEDVAAEAAAGLEKENRIPLKEQLKALLTNKYYLLLFILATVGGIVDNFKGGNVQYFYIKFLLGGEQNTMMYTIYQVITGTPLGIGAFIIYPLSKKFGIRNVSMAGYACVLVGSVLGWCFPSTVPIAMAAGFLRQLGMIPNNYIFATLLCYAFDSVEERSGYRLEGMLGVSLLAAVQSVIYAPFAGGFESGILKRGFVDVEGVVPSNSVLNFMVLSFYLFDILLAVASLLLLPHLDVEKKMPQISAALLERRRQAAIARGEEWVSPEEQEKRDAEAAERQKELDRVQDLKEYCAKKGLDFETENQKYLSRQKKKRARAHRDGT